MRTDPQTVLRQIDATGDCWQWTGNGRGGRLKNYGRVKYQGRGQAAHRCVWEMLVGKIPKGLVIDHLCKNTLCVNPDHLEPVTQAENIRRGATGTNQAKTNLLKTHCPQGHEYAGENLRVRKNGHRVCRICDNARVLAAYHRNKETNQ